VSLNQIQSSKRKDPAKKNGRKFEKKLGVPLAFFNFDSKIYLLNFERLMVGIF